MTRDLFEDPSLRPHLAQYTSRSSVISAVAAPVAIDPELVRLDSAFQRRCVLEDFGKPFFAQLRENAIEHVVIDLIDERFEVVPTDGSCVTRSSAFVGAGLDASFEGATGEPLRRLTGDAAKLLDEAVDVFCDRLTQVVPADRVVVHRAGWLTRFRTGSAITDFPADRAAFAERHNAALDRAYDRLEERLGGAHVIALDRDRYVADAEHRWDLEPYHYEPAYNAAAVDRLRTLIAA